MAIFHIKKWRHRYRIQLSKEQSASPRSHLNNQLKIQSESEQLTIFLIQKPKYELYEILAQITPENRHDEVKNGKATGAKLW
jgi:hypothetical protein